MNNNDDDDDDDDDDNDETNGTTNEYYNNTEPEKEKVQEQEQRQQSPPLEESILVPGLCAPCPSITFMDSFSLLVQSSLGSRKCGKFVVCPGACHVLVAIDGWCVFSL